MCKLHNVRTSRYDQRVIDMTGWNSTGRLASALFLLVLGLGCFPETAASCSQCFGTSVDNATTFGITMSMLGLLGFLGIVWGGIGLFVRRVSRRSKLLERENWVVTEDGEIEALDD